MTTYLNADLHCHSVVSDGTLAPEELAARAKANGVELWALTDHDEISGQHRAAAAARSQGMAYLTGTEISVSFANTTVHIVGLGFDADNPQLDLLQEQKLVLFLEIVGLQRPIQVFRLIWELVHL